MNSVKSYDQSNTGSPSVFALLVDDINKMTESEQKVLWMNINKEKLSVLANEIDASVPSHNFSALEIDSLINEARKNK